MASTLQTNNSMGTSHHLGADEENQHLISKKRQITQDDEAQTHKEPPSRNSRGDFCRSHENISGHKDGKKTISINDAIEYMGMGHFQYLTIIVAGFCFASDGIEIALLSFLSPTLQAEWDLEPWQASTITSVVFAGALLGTLFFGRLGDVIGRRPTVVCLAFTFSVFGFATAFVNDFVTLLCMRFIVGMGVGGTIVVYDLVAELLPSSKRGSYLMIFGYFWTSGSMLVPLVAAATLAISWRLFVSACAVPCFASAVFGLFLLPESPRWLVVKGRKEEAMEILQRMAMMNGKDPAVLSDVDIEDEKEESCHVRDLFKPNWRRLTLTIWGVWAAFGFCFYGVVITISRVFEHRPDPTQDCSAETDCSSGKDEISFDFEAMFFSSSAQLAGIALVIAVIDRVGRVPSQIVPYACGGISIAVLCWWVGAHEEKHPSQNEMLLLAYIARACEMMGNGATYVTTAELLPTEIRTTGHSVANALSRLGAFFSPYVVTSRKIPFPIIGGILLSVHLGAVVLCSLLPETKGQNLGSNRNSRHTFDEEETTNCNNGARNYQSVML